MDCSPARNKGLDLSFVPPIFARPVERRSLKYRRSFDSIVCFSVLHHIPGQNKQLEFLAETRKLLADNGSLILSVWQLSHVPRLRKKIIPWSTLSLPSEEFESNDLLVDWKMGGDGYRYVHEFNEEELRGLLSKAGLEAKEAFRSDGQTGDMGLYMVARKNLSFPK